MSYCVDCSADMTTVSDMHSRSQVQNILAEGVQDVGTFGWDVPKGHRIREDFKDL